MPTALQTALASMAMHGRSGLRTMADTTSGRMARLAEQRDERWEELRRLEEECGRLQVSYEEASADGLVEDVAEGFVNMVGFGGMFGIGDRENRLQRATQRTRLEIDTTQAKVDVIRGELSSASSKLSRQAQSLEQEEADTRELLEEQARTDRGLRSDDAAEVQCVPDSPSATAAESASLAVVGELERFASSAEDTTARRLNLQIDEVHDRKSSALDHAERVGFFSSVTRFLPSARAALCAFSNTFQVSMLATKTLAGISESSRVLCASLTAAPSAVAGALQGVSLGGSVDALARLPLDRSAELEAEAARAELRHNRTRDQLEDLSGDLRRLSESKLDAHRAVGRIRACRQRTQA